MHEACITLAFLFGTSAAGFLMAAAINFSLLGQQNTPDNDLWPAELLTSGVASLVLGATRFWRSRRDLRLLVYYGSTALLCSAALIYFASRA
jgi:hypothetical protein